MVLLIDTSGPALTIGVGSPAGEIVGSFQAVATPQERGIHDARLAVETERLLRAHAIPPSAIDRIGIVIGPGSFTGLRIGLSFVKGFASAEVAVVVPIVRHELFVDSSRQSNTLIVQAAYQTELAYVSANASPREVKLKRRRDFAGEETITMEETGSGKFLGKFLDLAIHSNPIVDLDALEPLYVTEFAAASPASGSDGAIAIC